MKPKFRKFGPWIALCGLILSGAPARARYTNSHSGTTWNNPTSNILDSQRHHNQQMMNTLMSQQIARSMLEQKTQKQRGALIIRRRAASTKINARPFDWAHWKTTIASKTPAQRAQWIEEAKIQDQIFVAEARSRGANLGDMAHYLAVIFALSWEAYSGQRATVAQFRFLAGDFRKMLLKYEAFQGMTAREKHLLAEEQMLDSTDGVRMWRGGKKSGDAALQASGRANAARFLARWWNASAERIVATPTGFTNRPQ